MYTFMNTYTRFIEKSIKKYKITCLKHVKFPSFIGEHAHNQNVVHVCQQSQQISKIPQVHSIIGSGEMICYCPNPIQR